MCVCCVCARACTNECNCGQDVGTETKIRSLQRTGRKCNLEARLQEIPSASWPASLSFVRHIKRKAE